VFSSDLSLYGIWTYGRGWRVAFVSLTYNRLTAVANEKNYGIDEGDASLLMVSKN